MREETSAARGAMALSIAGIVSKIISVAYTPILTQILGVYGYGIYSKVLTVFLFIYALTSAGVQPAVAKVVAEYNARENPKGAIKTLKVARKFYVLIGLLACLVMIAIAYPMAEIMKTSKVTYGIMFLGPCVFITCILSVYRGFMQGSNNMKAIAISQIIEQFINVILSLLCAYILVSVGTEYGVAGAQVGTSVGAFVAIIYVIFCFKRGKYEEEALKDVDTRKLNSKKIRNRILIYSIPIIMSSGLQNLGSLIDSGNVSSILERIGYNEVQSNTLYGYYGWYLTLIGVPMVIITAICTIVLPAITKARAVKDRKEIRRKIRFGYKAVFAIVIPSAVGLSMVAEPLYIALYGSKEGSDMLVIGSFILFIMAIAQLQTSILQGINKFYYILITYGLGIVLKIILNYICVGIPSINIYGVLIGNTAWYLVPAILNHIKIRKTTKAKINILRLIVRPIFASLIMALTIIIVSKPLDLIFRFAGVSRLTCVPVILVEVLAGAFAYLYVMISCGGIRKNDIESISARLITMMPRFLRKKLR